MVLSAFVIFTIFGIGVWCLPGGTLQTRLAPVVRPYFLGAGLDQGWGVFAPEPRRMTSDLYARLDFPDGAETIWRYPTGNALVSDYRTYRWQKWAEHTAIDIRTILLAPAAQWLVRNEVRNGEHPVEVTLVQRWANTPAPGDHTPPQWQEDVLYTWTSPSVPRFGI
jgi:hypothetical protein